MKAQRCWFLELPARRPAWRIRSRCVRLERPIGEPADDASRRDRPPRPGRSAISPDRVVGGRRDLAARVIGPSAAWRRAGPPGRASGSRPASSSTAANVPRRPGSARPGSRRRSPAASSGSSGPPRAVARNGATAAGSRRTRTARSAGRPRRRGSRPGPRPGQRPRPARAAARQALQVARGTTTSSAPWASRIGPAVAGDRLGRAEISRDDVAARAEVDAGRQPGQRDRRSASGIGRRASRNVWRVSRYGSAGREVATTAATRGIGGGRRGSPRSRPSSGPRSPRS